MIKNTVFLPPTGPNSPQSLSDLYWSFTKLALQGFGGVLAVAQRELVENKRWMNQKEFLEQWAVAQILPGPNVVNLALMIGDRYFGMRGALAALAGMLSLPLVVVLSMAALYAPYANNAAIAGALKGMGAVCAGLIAATGLKLLPALKSNPMGRGVCIALVAATAVAVAVFRVPLVQVLLLLGTLACGLAWRNLRTSK